MSRMTTCFLRMMDKMFIRLKCIIKLWVSTGRERLSLQHFNTWTYKEILRCVELWILINMEISAGWGWCWKIWQLLSMWEKFQYLEVWLPIDYCCSVCVYVHALAHTWCWGSPDSVSKVRCQVVWFLHMDNLTDWWMVVTSSCLLLSLAYLHRDCRPGCTPFIQLSSVKHNPGSYITPPVGLNAMSCYFLDAYRWGRGWLKVAENSLRKGQEVLQENVKWFDVTIRFNYSSEGI